MRRTRGVFVLLFALLLMCAVSVAEGVSGTVSNGTTGKPAGGVEVTLVDPMGGMSEIAKTKSDSQGHFKFDTPAAQGPRLARAEKGGVNYFKMITPGSANVDLNVYDTAASLEGITGSADVVRLQADGSALQAVELFAVRNESNPPRTLASASTFEFVLPDGAQIEGADAQSPNGQPITAKTTPGKEKNHYAFSFALKPGETRFQIAYHMPYSGKASFSPKLTRNFDHFVLVLPTSMSFVPKDPKQFQAMTNQPGSNVQVSLKAKSGQDLSFGVSGTGTIQDEQTQAGTTSGENAAGEAAGGPAMGGTTQGGAPVDNRPGGGLGRPGDEADGLAKGNFRWYILGLLCVVLLGGGIWTHERTKQEEAEMVPVLAAPGSAKVIAASVAKAGPGASVAVPTQGNLLLTALKEELFELEVERQQGKITSDEYEKARAALEQTLQRALARKKG